VSTLLGKNIFLTKWIGKNCSMFLLSLSIYLYYTGNVRFMMFQLGLPIDSYISLPRHKTV